ncbi:FtsX-like permease family protein [Pontibacter sp. G13]|uniref:ABC transporter permease n=1 Tax=Pontibacter sp. G13 TaxID=3074898 RepID=UPI002889EFAB|nr:FtsX-like permease family protein [Pontibacter sp. G13]WNJ18697.1 FtsX-like permease family protein [Pontibacter sp. G13]
MFWNALIIAIRNLLRHKTYSLINIGGLAIGIGCCLVIFIHLDHEWAYDQQHSRKDQIYRLALNRIYPEHRTSYALVPSHIGIAIRDELPQVEQVVRSFQPQADILMEIGDHQFRERKIWVADSTVGDVFDVEMVAGPDPMQALSAPFSLILTESAAKRLFPQEDPMGKMIKSDLGELMVKGICKDWPQPSHVDVDMLVSLHTFPFFSKPDYISFTVQTYLRLRPDADIQQVEAAFPGIVRQYAAGQVESRMNISFEDYLAAGNDYDYFLQPLTDIHLHSHLEGELKPNGSAKSAYLFVCVAVFILLIAVVNFMNLSTARSSERAKEVGVKKVLGSSRGLLVRQFLVESLVVSLIGFVVGLGLALELFPVIADHVGFELRTTRVYTSWFWYAAAAIPVLVGLLAGAYPAWVLSSFQPIKVLKGAFRSTNNGWILRNGLVVFQFCISMILTAATLMVYKQLQYTQEKSLGYVTEGIVSIERLGPLEDSRDALRETLLKHPSIHQAAFSNTMPGNFYFGAMFQKPENKEIVTIRGMVVDEHYAETMKMEMASGRWYEQDRADSASLILNEAAVKEFGLAGDPIGQQVRYFDGQAYGRYTVVGVVKDFHFQSLHTEIASLALFHVDSEIGGEDVLTLQVDMRDLSETLVFLEETWQEFAPQHPFIAEFLDEELAEMYLKEETDARLFGYFALLAIVIACVGLFGLSAFTTRQRAKEIGIRKVLGATSWQMVVMLSREITVLVGIALLISIPLGWWLIDEWLSGFTYHVKLGVWVFIAAGLAAWMIAIGTVGYQSLRAAQTNPADTLKQE